MANRENKRGNMVVMPRGKQAAWHTESGFAEKFILSEDCVERFLATSRAGTLALEAHGIIHAGESELRGIYEIGRLNPGFFAAAFCLSGKASCRTPGGEAGIAAGEFVAFPAFEPHLYWCEADWRIIWFHLSAEKGPWADLAGGETKRTHFGDIAPLCALMRIFMDEQAKSKNKSPRLLAAVAQALCVCVEREFRRDESAAKTDLRRRLDAAWTQVQNNFARDWSVGELASIAGMSAAAFHRNCREMHGASPMRRVRRMRMNLAAELLLSTAYGLGEIADKVGYENAFALSKAFKAEFGASPSEYLAESAAAKSGG